MPPRARPRGHRGIGAAQRRHWARTYEETGYRELPWFHERPDPWLAEEGPRLGAPGGARALDLGCGAGSNVLWMAEHGRRAVGVQQATGAVRAANARQRARRGSPGCSFVAGDALALPFRSASFDLASDIGCFHTLPVERRADYAHEVARVLRSEAPLLISFFAREETAPMGPPHRPSILEAAEALEPHFIFAQVAYVDGTRGGPGEVWSVRRYQLKLLRRSLPQPPPR